jgi:hypothetical protein
MERERERESLCLNKMNKVREFKKKVRKEGEEKRVWRLRLFVLVDL